MSAENPALAGELIGLWDSGFANHQALPDFAEAVRLSAYRHFQRGVLRAAPDLVTDLRKLELDEMLWLQKRGPDDCVRIVDGGSTQSELPLDVTMRRSVLIVNVLLKTDTSDGSPPAPAPPMPGNVIAEAAKRSGMSSSAFSQALRPGTQSAPACAARIALYQVILALPHEQSLPLLRAL